MKPVLVTEYAQCVPLNWSLRAQVDGAEASPA